jgi:hypothetical protein
VAARARARPVKFDPVKIDGGATEAKLTISLA